MTRFIFVTGGVVSSLGKGIAAASLAAVLEARGLRVTLIKLDPYINVDPGTMNPFQHGEVFVTSDGAETDLDLGYYERFVAITTTKLNNLTAGQIYEAVIRKERRGEYLGSTVQVIPHITDEIKHRIHLGAHGADVALIEVGGTVGDIESQPFLEAIRQMGVELGKQSCLFIHLTLVPYIKSSGEIKTKPTQHSVKELRSIGIQPDILLCRSDREVPDEERRKIALFTNVDTNAVISVPDVDTIYRIPLLLHAQGVDEIVVNKFCLINLLPVNLSSWEQVVLATNAPLNQLDIAIVGKYVELADAYRSLNEALIHGGIHTKTKINIHYLDAEYIESHGTNCLSIVDAILVPGGFGTRGIEGKIATARYAREHSIPYFGICLGMQVAVIEFARNVAGMESAHSTEFKIDTPYPVIALVKEWIDQDGQLQQRQDLGDLGASMRLGSQSCWLVPDSLAYTTYKKSVVHERHRHRYEFNNSYREPLRAAGLICSGHSLDGRLVEVIELPEHPWFLGCQFHPEFTSTPRAGHPLFQAFIEAGLQYRHNRL